MRSASPVRAAHSSTTTPTAPPAMPMTLQIVSARAASGRGLLALDDHRLHRGGDALGDLHDDDVGADVLDRLVDVDLAPVDLDPARLFDRVGDVLVGHPAEQAAVGARLLADRQDGA